MRLKRVVVLTACLALVLAAALVVIWRGNAMAEDRIYDLGPDGMPIIFWRISQHDYDAVERLLDAGADIETNGFAGSTPALKAAFGDNWTMVYVLIKKGAKIDIYDQRGATLAYLASTSRIKRDSRFGRDLVRVEEVLKRNGLYDNILTPQEIRDKIASGELPKPADFDRNNWPPQ